MTGLPHHRDDALRTRGQLRAAERAWAGAPQRLTVHNSLRPRVWPMRTMLLLYLIATALNIAHAAGWL